MSEQIDERLKREVLEVLQSSAAQHIRFHFPSSNSPSSPVVVDFTTFKRVTAAIGDGRVKVSGDVTQLARNLNSGYRSDVNTIFLRPEIRGRKAGALIVHESVHASLDLTRSEIPVIDDEAAAYLAGAFYYRRMGMAQHRYAGTLYGAALPAVNSVLRTKTADAAALEQLRTAVRHNYSHLMHLSSYLRNG